METEEVKCALTDYKSCIRLDRQLKKSWNV